MSKGERRMGYTKRATHSGRRVAQRSSSRNDPLGRRGDAKDKARSLRRLGARALASLWSFTALLGTLTCTLWTLTGLTKLPLSCQLVGTKATTCLRRLALGPLAFLWSLTLLTLRRLRSWYFGRRSLQMPKIHHDLLPLLLYFSFQNVIQRSTNETSHEGKEK